MDLGSAIVTNMHTKKSCSMLTLNASLVVGLYRTVSHSIASVANVSDNARAQLRSGSHSTSKAERKHTKTERGLTAALLGCGLR